MKILHDPVIYNEIKTRPLKIKNEFYKLKGLFVNQVLGLIILSAFLSFNEQHKHKILE